jgi:hypothetical protein
VSSAEGGGGGPETEPIYLDVTTLREPEKQIAETKLRDTEENRSFFMPILGRYHALQIKTHFCRYSFPGNCAASAPISTSCVCEQFIYSQDRSTYLAATKWADRSWKFINLSQNIYECRNWETEHYYSVLDIIYIFLRSVQAFKRC